MTVNSEYVMKLNDCFDAMALNMRPSANSADRGASNLR